MNVNTLEAGSYTGINRRDTLFQMHNKTIELRIEQAYVELSMK